MPSPQGNSYPGAPGATLYAGMENPLDGFTSVAVVSEDVGVPYTTADQTLVVSLHGSGGANLTTGRQFRAAVVGEMAYSDQTEFAFSTARGTAALGVNVTLIRPVDFYGFRDGALRRESHWMGFTGMGSTDHKQITERRLNALIAWAKTNVPNCSPTRRALTGGSMGGWGSITYGLRRANEFAAVYPDRPRWRYSSGTSVSVPGWDTGSVTYPVASAPLLAAIDGGGSSAVPRDGIAYVVNTANKVPWVGWCIGRNDGFAPFDDQVAAVVALRAAKRGFCFVWNDGNHTTGSILSQITASYPFGTFELGKGYPLFTNHSGDQDPAVDLVGGINEGLSFRSVTESAGAWSCEVTSVLGARTVTVEPISDIFTATVTPQVINIPAANTWVSVSFTA
jgi:hypothetical protein